eukprot:g75427.t1
MRTQVTFRPFDIYQGFCLLPRLYDCKNAKFLDKIFDRYRGKRVDTGGNWRQLNETEAGCATGDSMLKRGKIPDASDEVAVPTTTRTPRISQRIWSLPKSKKRKTTAKDPALAISNDAQDRVTVSAISNDVPRANDEGKQADTGPIPLRMIELFTAQGVSDKEAQNLARNMKKFASDRGTTSDGLQDADASPNPAQEKQRIDSPARASPSASVDPKTFQRQFPSSVTTSHDACKEILKDPKQCEAILEAVSQIANELKDSKLQQLRSKRHGKLDQKLREHQLRRQNIKQDGLCIFEAFAD